MSLPMGVTLHTGDLDFDDIVAYAQEAERLGYEGFWVTEESGKEAFAVLALLARATQRIRLVTGIVNFYSRSPTLLAMSAATIYRLSGGRFALGLGTGGIGFMERGHGIKIERPLQRARETVEIVRGLLTRPRFSYQGQWFHIRDFRLREGPVDGPLPIYLAALNPGMVRLAARVADGVIINWPTSEFVAEVRDIIAAEAAAAGRRPQDVQVFSLLMTCADSDDHVAVEALRKGIAFYCASVHYHHIGELAGLGDQVKRVYEAWYREGPEAATELVSEAMLEKFALFGSPEHCRRKLADLAAAGVYPIVYPLLRRERMREDHFEVIRRVADYARLPSA